MRHSVRTKKLNRSSAHRDLMLKNLAASIFQYESVKTTEAKAKVVLPLVERIITIAKKDTIAARRRVESMLPTKLAALKVIEVLAPRYKERNGGFVTTVRLPKRVGDNSRMVKITLLPEEKSKKEVKKVTKNSKSKKK